MATPTDTNDDVFSLSNYSGGGADYGAATANLTGSDAGVYDDNEQQVKKSSAPTNGWYDQSLLAQLLGSQGGGKLNDANINTLAQGGPALGGYKWSSGDPFNTAGNQMGSGAEAMDNWFANNPNGYQESAQDKLGSFTSPTGQILGAIDPNQFGDTSGQYKYFQDTFDTPGGSEHDKSLINYKYDPTTGNATPFGGTGQYQKGWWTDWGRTAAELAAVVGTAGAAGAYLAPAAGAGASGAAAGGGLTSADTAALFGNAGYGAGVNGAATNAALIDSAAGSAGYGASSAGAGGAGGSGFSLGGLGTSAGKGALVNGGMTAVRGGSLSDILKGAGYGALGGAVGYGVGEYNPGQYVTDSTAGQSVINRGVTGGVNAGLTGGNVGTGALLSGGTQAGNVVGGNLWNNYVNTPDNTGGGDLPTDHMDNFSSAPGSSPVADWFSNNSQQSQAPIGFTSSPEINSSLGNNTDNSLFNPDFGSSGVEQPTSQGNPFKQALTQAFGFGAGAAPGSGTPRFGDMAGSLAGLWSAYQQKKRLSDLRGGLQDMFSPNSAYAQQMGQALDRRDAAAGRRSQYGPRQVELQARLAEMNSRNAPTIQNLIGGETASRNQMLNNGLRLGQQFGLGSTLQGYAQPYLNQLFGSPMAQPNVGPQEF